MMEEVKGDHLCLRRCNFGSHFMNELRVLYTERDLGDVDVTLSAEEKYIQCHKWLLSLCSPYFKNMFRTNNIANRNTVVILGNINFRDLENLVHFMYNGEIRVKTHEEVQGILEAGELLKIEGLSKETDGHPKIQEVRLSNTFSETPKDKSAEEDEQRLNTSGTRQSMRGRIKPGASLNLRKRMKRSNNEKKSVSGMESAGDGPSVTKRTRVETEMSFVNTASDKLGTYGEGLVETTEADDLKWCRVDPLALNEEGLYGVESIEVKLEDVNYHNHVEDYINPGDDKGLNKEEKVTKFNAEDIDGSDEEEERLQTLEETTGSDEVKEMPGVPWYFPKYYGTYMSQLLKCFEWKACVECGMKVAKKYTMARHFLTHVPQNFPCSVCGAKLSNDSSVNKHMKAVHGVIGHRRSGRLLV